MARLDFSTQLGSIVFLSSRSTRALSRKGIRTIQDLASRILDKGEASLLQVDGFGPASLLHLRSHFAASYGLTLQDLGRRWAAENQTIRPNHYAAEAAAEMFLENRAGARQDSSVSSPVRHNDSA